MPDKERKKRPPYASEADVDRLFERMRRLGDPGTISTKWVEDYGLAEAQPAAIVSVLKWLKVVDERGDSLGVWNDLRIPAKRHEVLEGLIQNSYAEVFSLVDVPKASKQDLEGAFISAYSAGDPRRLIRCFLTLCGHAGVQLAASEEDGRRKSTPRATTISKPKAAKKESAAGKPTEGKEPTGSRTGSVGEDAFRVSLNVEIPADWSEDQIRKRVGLIRDVIRS